MPLSSGSRLGQYEIIGSLGVGGMGEVYRARDTRLHRDVAVKILPDAFHGDPERRTRFEREAHVLASLNHPNIAQIHGIEESSGRPALVMELVEGHTLDQLTSPLTIAEIVAITRQIAGALEAAHEQGIIHRDLKPSNVKVRGDGTVKVLDFGLAKAFDASSTSDVAAMNSPTLTVQGTQMGMVVGTAAYMAPEQARGKPVDRRADIWALGAVLYELLSGARAFEGETVSDTIAAVLTKDPDWSNVRSDAPSSLIQLTQRCLRKDPRRRLQSIGDVRVALEEIEGGDHLPAPRTAVRPSAGRRWALPAIALAAIGAITYLAASALAPRAVRTPRTVPILLAEAVPLTLDEAPTFALSSDGATLAFVGGSGTARQLYVRRLDSPAVTAIAGTQGASSPFFSPDGQWIAFVSSESLKKVRVSGSSPAVRLTAATDRGGVWLDDDTIVYSLGRSSTLFRVPAAGGEAVPLTKATAGSSGAHRFPTWIPERRALLFTGRDSGNGGMFIGSFDLQTGNQTTVLTGAYHPVYCAPGRLLFVRDSSLFSAPFDVDRLTVTGAETRMVDSLRAFPEVMAAQYAASAALLLYQPGTAIADVDRAVVVWRDIGGQERTLLPDPDTYRDLRLSPDGKRMAYSVLPRGLGTDLWVFDRARGLRTRLTYESKAAEWWPAWSPDGRSVAYSDTESGIKMMTGDGSGEKQTLTANAQQWQVPGSFSPDGKLLAYQELHRETAGDIWILPLAPKGPPEVFLKTPFSEGLPMFSPNGRWIAYTSNESGSFEIYVRPYPGPGPKHQVSGDQTFDVHYWSADGTRLFYRSGDGRRMMSVPVQTGGAEFESGKPSVLFELDPEQYPDMSFWGSFAAAPDGSGFALVKLVEREAAARNYLMMKIDW
jgi:Tol biopolymer transport system component